MSNLKYTSYDDKHFQLELDGIEILAIPRKTLLKNIEYGAYVAGRCGSPRWNIGSPSRQPTSVKMAKDADFYQPVFNQRDVNRLFGKYSDFFCYLIEDAAIANYDFKSLKAPYLKRVKNMPVARVIKQEQGTRTLVDVVEFDFHPRDLDEDIIAEDGYDEDMDELRGVLRRETFLNDEELENMVFSLKRRFGLVTPAEPQLETVKLVHGSGGISEAEKRMTHREQVQRMRDWFAGRRDDF